MRYDRVFWVFIMLFGIVFQSIAQDPIFNQYENNPVYINPGKIGRFSSKTVLLNQRFQSSSNSKYNTSQFTFVVPVYLQMNYAEKSHINHKGGIGISFLNDVIDGAFKTMGANVNFAYNWHFDEKMKHLISFGLNLGYLKMSVDLDNYTWGEQYDPDLGYIPGIPAYAIPDSDKATAFDTGFGILWSFKNKMLELKGIRNAEAGISFGHLNNPNISLVDNNTTKLPIVIKVHSTLYYALNEKYFTGAKIFYLQHQRNKRLNLGGTFGVNFERSGDYISGSGKNTSAFIMKETYVDLWASTGNSFGLALNLDFTSYKLGFSYETNYSTYLVNNDLGSAFELFLQAKIPKKKK